MKDDRKLVKQCKNGSHKAFDNLYAKYSPVLFGICLRYARDYSSAEDILQEAFITIINKIGGYRFEGSFEGWLKRVTVNTAINYIRKQSKQNMFRIDDENSHDPPSQDADVVSSLSEKELMKHIQALPDGYRTVFNMFVIEGYKHTEIAEILGVTESTSRTQLAKARRTLQNELMKKQ